MTNTTLNVEPELGLDDSMAKPPRGARSLDYLALALGIGAVVISGVILLGGLSSLTVGGLAIVLLLLLMAIGLPVGVAMMLASMIGLLSITGARGAVSSILELTFDSVASWSLSVIPMFTLMGVAMWKGGITERAFRAANLWLGRFPSGLAVATNTAGAGLAATSGSTTAITFALGRMALPEMLRRGYSPALATGSVAMAGTLGQIIPPSVLLVIYAGVASTPVGPQLIAGLVPGIMLAVAFSLVAVIWSIIKPSSAPRSRDRPSWRERFSSLIGIIPLATVVLTVLGGMLSGLFTATEAAAFGAFIAVVVGWWGLGRGKRRIRSLLGFVRDTTMDAISTIAALFLTLIGALLLGRMIILSGLAQEMTAFLVGLNLNRLGLLFILIAVYFVIGMFLESIPTILITVPLLYEPLQAVGIDMIWFGIFVVIMCEIGMVSPPVGMLVFILHRIVQDPHVNLGTQVRLIDIFKGVTPFVGVALAILVLLIFLPDIVLWLPALSATD